MSQQHSIEDLGSLLKSRRLRHHMSLRDLADEIDVSLNTLSRVERGHVPDLVNFRRILAWLDMPADVFLQAADVEIRSTPAVIARHLRADPNLSVDGAQAIADIVTEMYQRLSSQRLVVSAHLRSSKTFTPAAGRLLTEILQEMESTLRRGGASDDAPRV